MSEHEELKALHNAPIDKVTAIGGAAREAVRKAGSVADLDAVDTQYLGRKAS